MSKYPILNDILRLNEILSGGHHRLLLRCFRPFVTSNALEHVGVSLAPSLTRVRTL